MARRRPHLVPVVLLIGHDEEPAVVDQVAEQLLHREAGVSNKGSAEDGGERGGGALTSLLASQSISQPRFGPHWNTERRVRRRASSPRRLPADQLTVLDVWRLSVWLLARILNFSVQASRSSFTPTTESREGEGS